MSSILTFGSEMTYQNLNKILLSKEALTQNHKNLQDFHQNAKVCPVLKSNAYGHGLKQLAPIFDSMHCEFLIVDSLFEAYELYKMRVKTPILIMGYTDPENFKLKRLPFSIAIFDLELAKILNEYQRGCKVHVFVDTGMSREGVNLEDLENFLMELKKLKNLNITGLCSHLADADNPNSQDFVKEQIKQYKKALQIMNKQQIFPEWRHISASGGAFKVKNQTFNMIRAGIAHYGISPLVKSDPYKNKISLQPVLEFSSTLVQIKKIKKDAVVGYGCTFKARADKVLALLPAGYYEGVDKRLSNKGLVKIRDQYFPIVGRVSMNMTSIDISKLKDPQIGEKVIIYSSNKPDKNSISNAALKAKTIPYDLLVHLAESVKRVLI
ncbi:MAG TPA: alanine racemase [Candidatus Pacebacteria bacterium]|nr:alanine racemase [Candidatus Paceibacterota bacterium]